MSTRITRRAAATLVAAAMLLTAALAAAPQAQAGAIYACYKKKAGTVRIISAKAKCKKGEAKISWGTAGKNGANGANGVNGGAGKEGTAGKNGTNGTNGTNGAQGLNGTALAYAEVSSTGTLGGNSKGVTEMTPGTPSTGTYCMKIPGTLHVGIAGINPLGGGTPPGLAVVDMAPFIEIIFGSCAEGTTVAVHTYNVKGEAAALGFFMIID